MGYEKVKYKYINGCWNAVRVGMAVRKGVITQEQCDEILASK